MIRWPGEHERGSGDERARLYKIGTGMGITFLASLSFGAFYLLDHPQNVVLDIADALLIAVSGISMLYIERKLFPSARRTRV